LKDLLIRNAVIPARDIEKKYDIFIHDGKITKIIQSDSAESTELILKTNTYGDKDSKTKANIQDLDARGRMIVPGYIDLHIQGAGGFDVLDGSEKALYEISKTCAKYGVTGFLATTVYKVSGNNKHLEITSELRGHKLPGAKLLGIHLEGPFISPEKRGMIQPGSISNPSEKLLDNILELSNGFLKIMTIAPELPGSERIVSKLLDNSIVASFGHSKATYEEAKRGFDYGISHVTHIFNAMAGLHHREPGPLLAIYENKKITCQLIADGVHIHPAVLRFTADTITPGRLAIITDGMRPMGLPDGEYIYEGKRYISKDGTARYTDGTLVGTTLGLSELLNRFINFTNLDFIEVLKMGTEVPARVLGMDNYTSSLKEGMPADLLLLEKDFTPAITIVEGRIVFEKVSGCRGFSIKKIL